jgi:tRNA (adenine57-N1/adenine58-N1)-methyltransferase
MEIRIREGDLIALVLEGKRGRRCHLVKASSNVQYVKGVGRIDALVGKRYGTALALSGGERLMMVPALEDLICSFRREAQMITPKDSWFILFLADVRDGSRVVEIGSGSGGMAFALANAVGGRGRVYSYDKDGKNIKIAEENISKTPFGDRIEFKMGDCSRSIEERDVDAVVADIPDPWAVVDNSYSALKPCGSFVSYVPTFNQLGPLAKAMEGKFGLVDTYEILERGISVKEGAIRPKDFFPHTGYITRGRKLSDTG